MLMLFLPLNADAARKTKQIITRNDYGKLVNGGILWQV
jgi:hypothetical protein